MGDVSSFYVEIDDAPSVIFAGVVLENGGPARSVDILLPEETSFSRVTESGAWMSFPRPFRAGIEATIVWRAEHGSELRAITTSPLQRRDLQPHAEAGWVGYAAT